MSSPASTSVRRKHMFFSFGLLSSSSVETSIANAMGTSSSLVVDTWILQNVSNMMSIQAVDDMCTSDLNLASPRTILAQAIAHAEAARPDVARTGYGLSHAKTFHVSSLNEPRMAGCCGTASSAHRTAFPRLLMLGHIWQRSTLP
jgi:hypothetical protein